MLLHATSLKFSLLPEGIRRIDMDLVPGPGDAIECIGVDSRQRCFIADDQNEKSAAAFDRIRSRGSNGINVRGFYGALYEKPSLSAEAMDRWANEGEPAERPSFGFAEPATAYLTLYASTSTVEELIRQDNLGRKIFYIEIAIDGLKRTTAANSEGGLIAYTWQAKSGESYEQVMKVKHFMVHYYESTAYKEPAAQDPPLSRDDLKPFAAALERLVSETKRINLFLLILCMLTLVALFWHK
jgi:hypothetical protein